MRHVAPFQTFHTERDTNKKLHSEKQQTQVIANRILWSDGADLLRYLMQSTCMLITAAAIGA